MASLEEILDKCSVAELKIAAEENKLPISGSKAELISRLASSISAKKILNCISNKQLQAILGKYDLPKSGNKDEMIQRLLPLTKAPKQAVKPVKATAETKQTTTEKGAAFEKKVATWLKRQIKTKEVTTGLFKGKQAVRPFQIDIVARGINDTIVWVECKNRKSTIKRTDIFKFVHSAKDVKAAVGFYWGKKPLQDWDYLLFVSTSQFDIDAINFAKEHNVGCVYYDGRTFHEKNRLRD